MASLRLVLPGAATDGVTPTFFLKKTDDLSDLVCPLFFVNSATVFFIRMSPLEGVTEGGPPVTPLFEHFCSVIL